MIVYDVEVLRGPQDTPGGWDNPAGMGFGTAVAHDTRHNLYRFFGPDGRESLGDMLVETDQVVVTFNGKKFDSRVVLADNMAGAPWRECDLLEVVVRGKYGVETISEAVQKVGAREVFNGALNLDSLCGATLGMRKNGHGAHAPELIRNKQWAEVYEYNLNDVRLTKRLLDYARKYHRVIDRDANIITVEDLEWVYEKA